MTPEDEEPLTTPEPLQFVCEGCGVTVFTFGIARPPRHGFCAVCTWLCEQLAGRPEEFWAVYSLYSAGMALGKAG